MIKLAKIRILFLDDKTFKISVILSYFFAIIYFAFSIYSNEMNSFDKFLLLLKIILSTFLLFAYIKHDLLQLSAVATALLMCLLFGQADLVFNHLLNQDLHLVMQKGLVDCFFLALNMMVFFIHLLITWNHFRLNTYNINGKVKIVVNQILIVFQLILAITLDIVAFKYMSDFKEIGHIGIRYLLDTAVFLALGCCELILAIDKLENINE